MLAFLKRVPFPVYCLLFVLEVVALACASVGYGDWPVLAGGALVFSAVVAAIATPAKGAE